MADQGQWFKLWVGADEDPDLGNLSNEDFGRWAKLGVYIKKHGNNGTLKIKYPAIPLQSRFRVATYKDVVSVVKLFPNCVIEESTKDTVTPETYLTVTWRNWSKYQGDFSTARVRKFRQMKRSKRRGEEKREEENKKLNPLASPLDFLNGLKKNPAYSGIEIDTEFGKMKTWCDVNRKKPTERRFVNWLNRVEKPLPAQAFKVGRF